MAFWNCRDKKIEYGHRVLLMGIVNVTPDSFSDGGDWLNPAEALGHAKALEAQGADILDLGGQSTRPGHTPVSDREEWARLAPILEILCKETALPISVDTYYPYVAEQALLAGAHIINDVSGKINPEMAKTVRRYNAGWVVMHAGPGTPESVGAFFDGSVDACRALGIRDDQICLDMGIGFGKNFEQDLALIANIPAYKKEGYPLLLGCSRKRVIGRGSDQPEPKARTYGNIAADTVGILGGADMIRLHNIEQEKQGVLMAQHLRDARAESV